jgi:hypothetical protein
VRTRFPAINLNAILARQQACFEHAKLRTRLLGPGAVEDVLGPGHPAELLGELVRDMQTLLPGKAEREGALADPAGWIRMMTLARQAAATVAGSRGLIVQPPPPLPPFVPAP